MFGGGAPLGRSVCPGWAALVASTSAMVPAANLHRMNGLCIASRGWQVQEELGGS
jgi:uncharacterized paraquat-inducible protein A